MPRNSECQIMPGKTENHLLRFHQVIYMPSSKAVEEVNKFFTQLTVQLQSSFNTTLDWEQCEVLLSREQEAD